MSRRPLVARFPYKDHMVFMWNREKDQITLLNERNGTAVVFDLDEWHELLEQCRVIRMQAS